MPSTHTSLRFHFVFSTQNRHPWIAKEWRPRLYEFCGGCFRAAGGVLLEAGGTLDHVHLLVGLKPTHCVSDVLRDVKRATSAWIHDKIQLPKFAWQEGYGAFTVNPERCEGLVRYIRDQEEHHRTKTFQEEYLEFLNDHRIAYDERFLW